MSKNLLKQRMCLYANVSSCGYMVTLKQNMPKKFNHDTQTGYQSPVVENTWYQILLRMIISAFLYRIFLQYSNHNQETGREAFEEQPNAQNSLNISNTQKLIKYN